MQTKNSGGFLAFHKIAFKRPEHKKITQYMMGDRFDSTVFDAVSKYIDQAKGAQHRERHGHDRTAEAQIESEWGSLGAEVFRIHLLSDWLYDNLGVAVEDLYRRLELGEISLPYYDYESYSDRPVYSPSSETAADGKCINCGSEENIDLLHGWIKGLVCSQCFEVRNLEVCVECASFFAKQNRVESPDNPQRYLCPICSKQSLA